MPLVWKGVIDELQKLNAGERHHFATYYRFNIQALQNAINKWAKAANLAYNLPKDEVQILTHQLSNQPDLQPASINSPHQKDQVEIPTPAKMPCQKSEKNSQSGTEDLSNLEVKSEMAQTRMVVGSAFSPDNAAKVPDYPAKVPSHYIYSKSLISNLPLSNLQRVREDEEKKGGEEKDQRQNTNPDNPEFTDVNGAFTNSTQELTQPTAVNGAYANNTQEREADTRHTAYANNTQESIEQTVNFASVGQKEEEIFHKQINPQLDQNCAGGASSGVADTEKKGEGNLPTEKNEEIDPRWVKKKWRATGRLDERAEN